MMSCPTNRTIEVNSAHSKQGAIKINLPCSCHLHTHNEILIPKRFPCPNKQSFYDATLIHTIPAIWSNLKSFVFNPKESHILPTYKNISECLNSNWTLQIPHLNLTSSSSTVTSLLESIKSSIPPIISYSDTYGIHSDSLFLIWNITLTLLVAYLLFSRNRLVVAASLLPTAECQATSPPNSNHDLMFGLICFTFATFMLYVILYFLFQYFKSKNEPTDNKKHLDQRLNKRIDKSSANQLNKNDVESDKLSQDCEKPNTSRFRIEIQDREELLSLSPGEKLSASIECIEMI